jgi:hypothetical protein
MSPHGYESSGAQFGVSNNFKFAGIFVRHAFANFDGLKRS